ncbi:hypothetical protein D3C85_1572690 [compost metagenome]
MGRADIASTHEHVRHIGRIEGTERNMIGTIHMHMFRAAFRRIHALRRMQINRPAAEGDAVLEELLGDYVILIQDVVPNETAIFPFPRNRPDPFQR